MKNDKLERLPTIVAELDGVISEHDDECALLPGNGKDESVLVGTPDAFLRLAKTLVEIVYTARDERLWSDSDFDREVIGGELATATNSIKFAFKEHAQIWPVVAYLVETDAVTSKLIVALEER